MTREECDDLLADLQRICVLVEAVEPQRDEPERWQIVAWCPNPIMRYTIRNAKTFREAVHTGLTPVLPKGALDLPTERAS
jgi:hypothetical protein